MPQDTSTRQATEPAETVHTDAEAPAAAREDTSEAPGTPTLPSPRGEAEPPGTRTGAAPPPDDAVPAPGATASPGTEGPAPDAEPAAPAAEADPPPSAETAPSPEDDRAAPSRPALAVAAFRAVTRPVRRLRRAVRRWKSGHPVPARALSLTVTVLALALVLAGLLMPNRSEQFEPAAFARIPVEGLLAAAVLLALPRRPRAVVAALAGLVLGLVTVLDLLDMGFNSYLGRGFNVVLDWPLLGDAESYVADTIGGTPARLATVAVVVLVGVLLVLMALAVVRIGGLIGRHPSRSTRLLLLCSTVWMTCSALDVQLSGVPVASDHTVEMVRSREQAVRATIRDERAFAREAKADVFGATPPDQLVPDLRGKDMIFTFIESYGRSAIEDPVTAPGVDRTLDAQTQALAEAGFHAKSGWLTSATYGGSSWLGHSTFLSGLWIDNQSRYRTVTAGDHLTLTKAFQKTGAWDTVGVMPGVQKGWPEQKFYGLQKVYDAFHLGYHGPKFSWSTMPDQYALERFQQLEHGRKRDKPLMSELILTSSHQPWAPIPKLVGWDELGDGRIFGPMAKAGNDPKDIITDSQRSKEEYGKSIEYSVTSLVQWIQRYGTDDTVLVFLGDHQPIARVSGNHASRDVPVSIVAKDPKVLEKIAGWNWTDGLRPAHDAPVWKMNAFRDRFLTAYGSVPHPSGG
ncbi:CDP-alcohol phosphatidyltransferase [Streptomyces sp. MUM 2J]|uniref:CDP-alcohol phosphatidyltransferase n=1 Tax=unclassified Streptomyces TaxID=2593676 RepID=UPI0035AB8A9D|nr:CDP-alcohol phosphatidyltransferase [Streptomyces sp. MUM 2J]MCH0568237.1 CDP-alcohol phosphatidyltransferase [Streptomyces sp. MUM 136J]